jgi:hypothetical protein
VGDRSIKEARSNMTKELWQISDKMKKFRNQIESDQNMASSIIESSKNDEEDKKS